MRYALVLAVLVATAYADPAEQRAYAKAIKVHADAQVADRNHCVANACTPQNVEDYERAEMAYRVYLDQFPRSPNALGVRYSRAQILELKLGRFEDAGDEYWVVGKSPGPLQRDALLSAANAYDRARTKVAGPVDAKLVAAAELYLTTFAGGPDVTGIMFRLGQLAFDPADYAKAAPIFASIVEKYPQSPNAGPAGDRLLQSLANSSDFAGLEATARWLLRAPVFAARDRQEMLGRLIVEAIVKHAEQEATASHVAGAAELFARAADEAKDQRAATYSIDAAVMFEKAKQLDRAVATYFAVVARFPTDPAAPTALFAAAKLDEELAGWEPAAELYERLAQMYPASARGADALYNAGVLREALGQYDRAIADDERFVRNFSTRGDAPAVAFEAAELRAKAGDHAAAEQAFEAFARNHQGNPQVASAQLHAAREALASGKLDAADHHVAAALAKRLSSQTAVEARFVQGEIAARRADQIELAGSGKRLAAKLRATRTAQAIYGDVVELGDPTWAVAALLRKAAVLEAIVDAIAAAPDKALEDSRAKLRTEATELYKLAYAKALELHVYSSDTLAIRAALIRLGVAPAEREARASR